MMTNAPSPEEINKLIEADNIKKELEMLDKFASNALVGLLANDKSNYYTNNAEILSRSAYIIARFMVSERRTIHEEWRKK